MSWQGANIVRRKRASRERHQRSSETVEAALNRLSKSYSAAMDCVGACHRVSSEIKAEEQNEKRAILLDVARTARKTLERAILADPLVRSNVSGLIQIWEEQSKQESSPREKLWIPAISQLEPPVLTSAAHRSTVRKLSYLSLLNYADLLLSGCACRRHQNTGTVLDRGVVDPLLDIATDETYCCWTMGEPSQDPPLVEAARHTARLALVAYMDAAHLDGSDPTIWFKMAAAARRLDYLRCAVTDIHRYRRLEQHALESAQACWLEQHRPPNHAIAQAWKEWQQLNNQDQLIVHPIDVSPNQTQKDVLCLSLNRYSWAVVGRTLLRACREGTLFRHNPQDKFVAQTARRIGVNPVVRLQISPLLTLPSMVLGQLMSFLEDKEVARIEGTCRALSVAVLAARVRADHAVAVQNRKDDEKTSAELQGPLVENSSEKKCSNFPTVPPAEKSVERTTSVASKDEKTVQASRVSKRLRSQILNSGKIAERSSRRSSVAYCLIGATLGVSPECREYTEQNQDGILKKQFNLPPTVHSLAALRSDTNVEEEGREQAQERISPASLLAFVATVSKKSQTPFRATFQYLSHVSMYVDAVYSCESHGSLVLSTCLMDALDLLVLRSKSHNFIPCWSAADCPETGLSRVELFAIDLLHSELRLKRCERDDYVNTSFYGDISFVGLVLPSLISFTDSIENPGISLETWASLKVRSYWLASTFLLWRARSVQGAPEVLEAENECLLHIERIVEVMNQSGLKEVRTPHLEGTGRTSAYWKRLSLATLAAFRNEIQASSVVLVAQDQFVEALTKLESVINCRVTLNAEKFWRRSVMHCCIDMSPQLVVPILILLN
jgi:hypothetical protein